MPFTLSHPAIILPLTYLPKKWISLTGLVVGSLTPDFEYFIRMRVKSIYSHTLDGLFWFDLPLGIILTFIFHLIIRNTLFRNLPRFLNERFFSFTQFDWTKHFKRNWIVVVLSILVGAASHIFWDSFTHDHGYFVESIKFIPNHKIEIFGISIPIHKIIQHLSTIIGAFVILMSILKLPKNGISNNINYKYWSLIFVISPIIVLIRVLMGLSIKQYGNILVTGMSAVIIALILAPFLVKRFSNDMN